MSDKKQKPDLMFKHKQRIRRKERNQLLITIGCIIVGFFFGVIVGDSFRSTKTEVETVADSAPQELTTDSLTHTDTNSFDLAIAGGTVFGNYLAGFSKTMQESTPECFDKVAADKKDILSSTAQFAVHAIGQKGDPAEVSLILIGLVDFEKALQDCNKQLSNI